MADNSTQPGKKPWSEIYLLFYCLSHLDQIPRWATLYCHTVNGSLYELRSRHGRDRMVAGFITPYAISAYRH